MRQKFGSYQKIIYLCTVFFIGLDLRLTFLGLSGVPFFMYFGDRTEGQESCVTQRTAQRVRNGVSKEKAPARMPFFCVWK